MRYEAKVALRYLLSSKMQTALLIGGVGVGVLVFCFMSALINGLASYQIEQTVGSIPHITIEPREQTPKVLGGTDGTLILPAILRDNTQRSQIRAWQTVLDTVLADDNVRLAVPVVAGNGFITRGQAVQPVSITGVNPEQLSEVAAIGPAIIKGTTDLDLNGIIIGSRLARNLSIDVGQTLVIRSDRGGQRDVKVRGIFSIGVESLDERVAYMNFKAAKALLNLDNGISRIEIKLKDLDVAPALSASFAVSTGLKVTSWVEKNKRLFDAIQGQGSTGSLIKFFSIVTIIIGVSSALLLTTVRRKSEIGIMRSMGMTKGFINRVFVIQGVLIGLLGAAVGSSGAFAFTTLVMQLAVRADGSRVFPIDPSQGAYVAGIMLATVASTVAAILPARAASRVDPLEAISQ